MKTIDRDSAVKQICKDNALKLTAAQFLLFLDTIQAPHLTIESMAENPDGTTDEDTLELAGKVMAIQLFMRDVAFQLSAAAGCRAEALLVQLKGEMMKAKYHTTATEE